VFQDTINNKNLDTISTRASIVFDKNAAILTNTWKNILDKKIPGGKIDSVRLVSDTTFRLYYSGADSESGMRFNDLYTSKNGSKYTGVSVPFGNSILIKGNKDTTYDLILMPHDNVGNFLAKTNPEAHFTLFNLGPITGDSIVCAGSNLKLTDTTSGGSWSSSDATVATIDSTGNMQSIESRNSNDDVYGYQERINRNAHPESGG
jgi:hypothetical protein